MDTPTEFCPNCKVAGTSAEAIQASCGSHMTCPKRTIPIEPGKHIPVGCDCGARTVIIFAGQVMHGKVTATGNQCPTEVDFCKARDLSVVTVDGAKKRSAK